MTTIVREEVGEGLDSFRSPVRVLADWFRRSRDNWKQKYMEVKAELKRLKVRVVDMNKSRSQWRKKSEVTQRKLEALQAELEELRSQIRQSPSDDEPAGMGAKR